jgi:hypothetical protein
MPNPSNSQLQAEAMLVIARLTQDAARANSPITPFWCFYENAAYTSGRITGGGNEAIDAFDIWRTLVGPHVLDSAVVRDIENGERREYSFRAIVDEVSFRLSVAVPLHLDRVPRLSHRGFAEAGTKPLAVAA